MSYSENWHGKGRTQTNPARFVNEKEFLFGGRTIPAGCKCTQYETRNFGWTIAKREGHPSIVAKE